MISEVQAAQSLGLSRSTLQSRRTSGHIPDRFFVCHDGQFRGYTDTFLSEYDQHAPIPQRPRIPCGAHTQHVTTGLTPTERLPDPSRIWDKALDHQSRNQARVERRYQQSIVIHDDKPIALAVLSDIHFGNRHTDYAAAKRDAELIANTPGMYAAILGDCIDNWVTPKTQGIQREQVLSHSEELALVGAWLQSMREKLVAVVSGNHELRSYDIVGWDIILHALDGIDTLYDQHEIIWALHVGDAAEWICKARHQWNGRSEWNGIHAQVKDTYKRDASWDIAFGGHVHRATCFHDFINEATGDHKLVVQVGSYEYDSAYARRWNLGRSYTGGSAAIIFYPDGRRLPVRDLQTAADFLAFERERG